MAMPVQKPGKSKQNFATPEIFIMAAKVRLGITHFDFDFAADLENSKGFTYWDESVDSLSMPANQWAWNCRSGWGWLNPPFADIRPWAKKCSETKAAGGSLALLVPAAVGSNWFRDFVDGQAKVLLLNGRIAFDPEHPSWGYPKDCMLCLYSPSVYPGYEVWRWKP